jgi:hypothetical protein
MEADGFEFFGIAQGGGFNLFDSGIAQDAEGNSGVITLLFIALEAQRQMMLEEALVGDFDAFVVLLHLKERGGSDSTFDQVIGIVLSSGSGIQKFEDFAGSDGGRGGSELTIRRPGNIGSIFAEILGALIS